MAGWIMAGQPGARPRGARGILSLFSFALLLGALLLGLGTAAARAQETTPAADDLEVAHLSPDGCSELIINGGFEVTDLHWGLSGTALPPSYSTARAYSGTRSMRLGIVDSANLSVSDGLYQDVALPNSMQSFTLSFHYWPVHESGPGNDAQILNVYEATTGVRLAQPWSRLSNTQTWQFEQVDLSHLRGRTVRIEFSVLNDGAGGRTGLYLDDVSLLACEPDATPFVTPPATGAPAQPGVTPQPVATPLPVTTPLPSGCAASDTLQNGNFEQALNDWSDWIVGKSPTVPALSEQSFAGSWSLRLGNPPGGNTQNISSYSSVRQLIELPADATSASLRWNHLSRSQEADTLNPTVASDRQELILLRTSMETAGILYRRRTEIPAWETMTVDLTPYLGGSYYLYFNVFNDGNGLRTWMYLDDVVVNVCHGNAAAPNAEGSGSGTQLQETPTPAATPTGEEKSAVAQPGAATAAPASGQTGTEATPTQPVRGTIVAVGVSTPAAIVQRSSPSSVTSEAAGVTVWQRFRRIAQTAQGQTFLLLLLIVVAAIGYLRFRESRGPRS